ncbi:hypothetical protein [Sporisorium scitamineum]|uniref:Uncharacterized protein n=1 Tax=Sporisorium scitamineum TaxID=49012 RepID=A0A0F7RWS9_9BASI|nr:hypothetical protein [Sporisorium scitamineum]
MFYATPPTYKRQQGLFFEGGMESLMWSPWGHFLAW